MGAISGVPCARVRCRRLRTNLEAPPVLGSCHRIGRSTAEPVQTSLSPPPPTLKHPGTAFATNGAPIPPQGAPNNTAHLDLCNCTVKLPALVEDGTTKFT